MRVINLTHGPGNGVNQACLMTASNMLIGKGEDGDRNDCVCELLRSFILNTNDKMPIFLLRQLYGPLVWEILGTKTTDPIVLQQRKFEFYNWFFREFLPEFNTDSAFSHKLKKLPKMTELNYEAICDDLRSTLPKHNFFSRVRDLVYNIKFNSHKSVVQFDPDDMDSHNDNISQLSCSVCYLIEFTIFGRLRLQRTANFLWGMCPDIIRRVAAIGDKRPVETVLTYDQLADKLS